MRPPIPIDPSVSTASPSTAEGDQLSRFVVQNHRARTHHFDFRVEKDGVLKSWAVPKGPPLAAGERRLAIQVGDHPLEYGGFEGKIPAGQYGAGTVMIWDYGPCEVREWSDDRIVMVLHGQRLRGCYGLLRLPQLGPRHWLFLAMRHGSHPAPVLSIAAKRRNKS